MSIAFSILLLLVFALIFWVFRTHKNAFLRALVIALFFGLSAIVATSFDSFMGWGAKYKYLPEIVTLRHISIEEPDPSRDFPGQIFLLITGYPTTEDMFLKTFGYRIDFPEPRLFRLPYSRQMHEQLQGIIPRLNDNQTVTGKLTKPGEGKKGEGEGQEGREGSEGREGDEGDSQEEGDGSDSLSTEFQFHELPPSFFLRKD